MKKLYDDLTKENINKNLFEVDFEFDELSEIEKMILKNYIIKITDDIIDFELISVDKITQPLDILIKLKNNKLTGDVYIKMINKEGEVLGIFKIKTLKIIDINNLIYFDFLEDDVRNSQKTISVKFVYDDILYSNDGKEYEKLT